MELTLKAVSTGSKPKKIPVKFNTIKKANMFAMQFLNDSKETFEVRVFVNGRNLDKAEHMLSVSRIPGTRSFMAEFEPGWKGDTRKSYVLKADGELGKRM